MHLKTGSVNIIIGKGKKSASYSVIFRSLRELLITDTELKLIAAAAIIGDSNKPNTGYNIPAAIGTPTEL